MNDTFGIELRLHPDATLAIPPRMGQPHVSPGHRPGIWCQNISQAPTGRNKFSMGRGHVAGEDLNTEAVTLTATIKKNFEELGI
jgi:hypothetical protein